MTLVLAAALAGVFGLGPLSRATAGARGGPPWVDYERFARFRTPTTLSVHLGAAALRGTSVSVLLRGPLVERLPMQRISPQPVASSPVPDGQLYTFPITRPSDSVTVCFVLEPGRAGNSHGSVAAPGGATLSLSQFVYP